MNSTGVAGVKNEAMSGRERILACLRGEETDRLPVWLKMANRTWKSAQPEPYASMDEVRLLRACGCDLLLGCGLPVPADCPHVRRSQKRTADTVARLIETPDGPLVGEDRIDPLTGTTHPGRFMLETPDDLKRMRWVYLDTVYRVDLDRAEKVRERQGRIEALDAVTTSGCGPSPFMDMVQHLAGPENTYYLMADAPEAFDELIELMHADRLRMLRARMPYETADTFWLTENTSTTLLSPALFEKYCVPHLAEYGRICLEYGRIPVHHMCGALNALLEMIDPLPAVANEAYTTRPLGDVSLAEGRARMPSKVLIGGTNATLWLGSVEKIVESVRQDLAACPDRRKVFLTSAGVLPPAVDFAKAKAVVEEFKRL
ncbi:MAG: hypothetical protein GXP31_18380 [Kiritimatiellaeota bacterium]|nr:hypothetical protein [Kiritimatiellota bacterium]